ncbi:MAG: hypothetical protein AAF824_13660 [Bacteroidota bacterium]
MRISKLANQTYYFRLCVTVFVICGASGLGLMAGHTLVHLYSQYVSTTSWDREIKLLETTFNELEGALLNQEVNREKVYAKLSDLRTRIGVLQRELQHDPSYCRENKISFSKALITLRQYNIRLCKLHSLARKPSL